MGLKTKLIMYRFNKAIEICKNSGLDVRVVKTSQRDGSWLGIVESRHLKIMRVLRMSDMRRMSYCHYAISLDTGEWLKQRFPIKLTTAERVLYGE
jgi:hypothetical protein